jgi:hypothetical protein
MAILTVEAPACRQIVGLEMAQVPLAADGGQVAAFLQSLRQGAFVQRQAVAGPGPDHTDLQTVPHRVASGHQGGTGRRTDRLYVKLLEFRTPGGQLVQVRGLDRPAMPAHVAPAEVVGEEIDDVGLARRLSHIGR